MPIYEYKCVDCDERFEVEQSMKAATLKKIKGDDHTHNVKKVFSPVGIAFKGSGFYKNDSSKAKKSGSKSSGSDSSDSKKSGDSKPAESKKESKSTEKKSSDAKATSK